MSKDATENPATIPVVVFVVEDDPMLQQVVGAALEDAGFAVVVAHSGDEALVILDKNDPVPIRAVVTDVDLGTKVTGWDVAKRSRELQPDIPVVYMTGGSAAEWSANGVPNSVLITKPFAPAQVVTAVSQLLNAVPPSST
jgi:DNA-binding response OmpR family regulator